MVWKQNTAFGFQRKSRGGGGGDETKQNKKHKNKTKNREREREKTTTKKRKKHTKNTHKKRKQQQQQNTKTTRTKNKQTKKRKNNNNNKTEMRQKQQLFVQWTRREGGITDRKFITCPLNCAMASIGLSRRLHSQDTYGRFLLDANTQHNLTNFFSTVSTFRAKRATVS